MNVHHASTSLVRQTPSLFQNPAASPSSSLLDAAWRLLSFLEKGQRIDAAILRSAMETAFGGSDADGAWTWKAAYDSCEVALVLFLRKYGPKIFAGVKSPAVRLEMFSKLAALMPTHTSRTGESETFQQFSTPITLGLVAATAAGITPHDCVLEPSAGTGLLAILAELAGGSLILNELAENRFGLLSALFPAASITQYDAAQIHDRLSGNIIPSVVLMNPPFSAAANVTGHSMAVTHRHIASALARLAEGGRLVAITGKNFAPSGTWRDAFVSLQKTGRVVFTAAIDGSVYAKHGTSFDVRLTVIDKIQAKDPTAFPTEPDMVPDAATLLGWIAATIPPRPPTSGVSFHAVRPSVYKSVQRPITSKRTTSAAIDPIGVELAYTIKDDVGVDKKACMTDAIYEPYVLQAIEIPGAQSHPTKLVQSAAMASVAPPKPSYRPRLPEKIVADGLLSDAQLETVIYAGEAHSAHLGGSWTINETCDVVTAAKNDAQGAVRFRRGFMLGDGTGAGKGRQGAAIILDNWMQGRKKAVWISKSDKLLEDAQRDWSSLGMERLLVTPLSRFSQGKNILLSEGILFTTYATLRSDQRGERVSRVRQIVDWLGADFDGVIIFDESHEMANAASSKGERGDVAASQQGRAGLRLQNALPDARVVYVSATGATTVHNLAYAQRLGLWGSADFPFSTREEFVTAIEAGGVAAMEVLARDLRALGLYVSRSLSYEGVEYELLEHQLTPEQIHIYDSYAAAFAIIHNNLEQALETTGIIQENRTLNGHAKSAARSAFESAKQRFFGHLLTSMKTPTLLRSVQCALDDGHAAIIQIVSTGEALMERRLAEIPTEEWNDVRMDITPREYVLDYLAHSFPVQLFESYSGDDGALLSRPVVDEHGNPVLSRDALARRDELIIKLASLPPVPGALDQIVQHFGTDIVAEVTGRSRRIVRKTDAGGHDRLAVENRPASANLGETQIFMDDKKGILIFSNAGGTGRSYHADLAAKNQRLRVHYLLEPGWKADAAIQGLGRTNRTNQKQPPLFRPIATNVKAEKRFLSTIARRLDTLGAITRGQRQTGGQGLFRPEDNLESPYARAALQQLYSLIVHGKVEGCSLQAFEAATGLKLTDECGIRENLPPITTFLNRLLALTIDLQGILFTTFEQLLNARIESAMSSGAYDVGLETLKAESFVVNKRQTIYTHPGTGAETELLAITQKKRNNPLSLEDSLAFLRDKDACLLINERSRRAAVQIPASGIMLDTGEIERRVRLLRPMEQEHIALNALAQTLWKEADQASFARAWSDELNAAPEFAVSRINIVSGLLLPVWKRLPADASRVYRLQTDDGERIIGRKVPESWVAANLSTSGSIEMSAEDAHAALLEGKTILHLAEGLSLRRSRVMNRHRIELTDFTSAMRERLSAYGLFHEIIAWKLRMFVPADATGVVVLERLLDFCPIQGIADMGDAA